MSQRHTIVFQNWLAKAKRRNQDDDKKERDGEFHLGSEWSILLCVSKVGYLRVDMKNWLRLYTNKDGKMSWKGPGIQGY